MLRRLRINPNLSAYSQTFRMFNYNQTPLAPLGTKAFAHKRLKQRALYADHGKIGYVIGPSMKKYRHLHFYIPLTREKEIRIRMYSYQQNSKCQLPARLIVP